MARAARDTKLENRTNRLKLTKGKRYFKAIGKGLWIVYRRTDEGFGTWAVKMAQPGGKYALQALKPADDHQDADGKTVLNYYQAQDAARAKAKEAKERAGILIKPRTVKDAAERYLEWFRKERKSVKETEHTVNVHIVPALGDKLLADLTSSAIQQWLEDLANRPGRVRASKLASAPKYRAAPKTDEEKRARRASANRILNVLKAILNKAFSDKLVNSDGEWRRVKAFRNVDHVEIRYLEDAEAVRLVNACPADLRSLVRGGLLTGCRFGELAALHVADVKLREEQIYIARSKSGKPRRVPLNAEGLALFKSLTIGKASSDHVFTRADDHAWGKNHHVRALKDACKVAKIAPAISFHDLRHTYATMLINAGVKLEVISKLLGHADMRITLKHYADIADRVKKDAVNMLPSFGADRRSVVAEVVQG